LEKEMERKKKRKKESRRFGMFATRARNCRVPS
jgi:hypothetical protein